MAAKKKIWRGRKVYERWLDLREQGGWSLAELARRSRIPESTLQRWNRRLRDSEAESGFVEDGGHPVGNREDIGHDTLEQTDGHGRILLGPPTDLLAGGRTDPTENRREGNVSLYHHQCLMEFSFG